MLRQQLNMLHHLLIEEESLIFGENWDVVIFIVDIQLLVNWLCRSLLALY
jgi:hypothetical protein